MQKQTQTIINSDPRQLAALLDGAAAVDAVWQPGELAAVFRHQLAAPVQFDLAGLDRRRAQQVRLLAAAQGLVLKSFRDLLQHPAPPVQLLELVKDFAKRAGSSAESPLPKAVATVLYYAAIAAARLRCDRRITRLDDAELRRGCAWARDQEWLDPETRELFTHTLARLESAKGARP
jgi:hypothetical protein